jgi:hypothetical protein
LNFFNTTPVPAKVAVGAASDDQICVGMLVAKATFRFDTNGRVELDTQEPFPLLEEDVETPLGVLPADHLARRGERFEVMLLGYAYVPGRRPAPATRVSLAVGKEKREILVFGDRAWIDRKTISRPLNFDRMPLTYDRSYGGSYPLHLDASSILDVSDPVNRRGRGFDAEAYAQGLGQTLRAPQGFPVLLDYRRLLPNLENPAAPIAAWQDAPEPVGWAPSYRDTAISYLHLIRRESERVRKAQQRGSQPPEEQIKDAEAVAQPFHEYDQWLYRAHSDWIIDLPPAEAPIRMENLLPDAPSLELKLPPLRLVADYTVYGRQGERDLRPHALVLLPEQKKLYLVYRMPFRFEPGAATERAFRLRTETGWFTPPPKEGHA